MPDNTYTVGIGAETKDLQNAFALIEGTVDRVTRAMEGDFSRVNASLSRMEGQFGHLNNVLGTLANAVKAAFTGYVVADMVNSALEQERAITELAGAYKGAGIYSATLMNQSMSLASAMQVQANQADEATLANIALMENIGRLSADKIPAATRAAIGLSAAYGIDAEQAFKLVGKAAQGHTEQLGRLGIIVGDNLSGQEKFNRVLEIGERYFQIAAARAGDAAGKYEQLKLQLGELKEAIGAIGTTPLVLTGLREFTELIANATFNLSHMEEIIGLIELNAESKWVKGKGWVNKIVSKTGGMPGGDMSEDIQRKIDNRLAYIEKQKLRWVNSFEDKNALGDRAPLMKKNRDITGEMPGGGGKAEKRQVSFLGTGTYSGLGLGGPGEGYSRGGRSVLAGPGGAGEKYTNPGLGQFGANNRGVLEAEMWKEDQEGIEKSRELYRQAEEQKIQYTFDGYEQRRQLAEQNYEWERENLVQKYGKNSQAVQALEQMHAEEMIGINREMTDQMLDDSLAFGERWGGMLISWVEQSDGSFRDIAGNFSRMLLQMSEQAAAAGIISGLFNLATGGTGGFLGGFMGAVKSVFGFRENGGPVLAGHSYIVGEKRPEVFTPRENGYVYPSVPKMAAGNTTYSTLHDNSTIIVQLPQGVDFNALTARKVAELVKRGKRLE